MIPDRQAREMRQRQAALFEEADKAWKRGNQALAMQLERRAAAVVAFYD